MHCPKCNSKNIVKNGCTHYGKQRLKCQNCGRQFVENLTRQPINHSTRELIDKLLLERVSLAAMPTAGCAYARVTGVSLCWLQYHVNQKYYQVSKSVEVTKKKPGRLVIQIDEMWSDVGSKANKQWIWQAIDSKTREIVGVYVGDRSAQAAKQLWRSLPPVDRQCAVCYTDFWEAYKQVLPSKRHCAVGKDSGQTSYIERLNNTVSQRVSRLVRKTTKLSN